MKDKSFKFKKNTPATATEAHAEYLRERLDGDECKVQFVLWAHGTWLDVAGIYDGDPVFRPAICAWEAWKAAWSLRSR